jgi:hypothetical protein
MYIDNFYIRDHHMKCTLYTTIIALFLASDLKAMDESQYPALQPAARQLDQVNSNVWKAQKITLAEQIKTSEKYAAAESPQPKKLYPAPSVSKTPPPVAATQPEDEIFDEDDQTPYTFKDDRRYQDYLDRCYQGSPVKARKNAERIAHILDKRSDINPPRAKEPETPKPSEPIRQLVHNELPQETLKKKQLTGNNTTQISHMHTSTSQQLPCVSIPLMSAVLTAHVVQAACLARTLQSDTAHSISKVPEALHRATKTISSAQLSFTTKVVEIRVPVPQFTYTTNN